MYVANAIAIARSADMPIDRETTAARRPAPTHPAYVCEVLPIGLDEIGLDGPGQWMPGLGFCRGLHKSRWRAKIDWFVLLPTNDTYVTQMWLTARPVQADDRKTMANNDR